MGFWDSEIINEAEKETSFEPIPEGTYRVLLTDSEVKKTKAGGHYLNAKFELAGNPELDGRVLFHKFNVDNSNATAVAIGLGQIKELSGAANQLSYYEQLKQAESWAQVEDMLTGMFDTLGNIPIEVKVIVKQDEKYGPQNDIKRFKGISGGLPTIAPQKAAPAAVKGKGKAPWEK